MQTIVLLVAEISELALQRTIAGAIGIGMLVIFLAFFVVGLINPPKHKGLRVPRRCMAPKLNPRNYKIEPLILIEQETVS